ncbi:MAG: hypothetical protein ACRDZQ_01610 [Acidimicrobiales bacterium]
MLEDGSKRLRFVRDPVVLAGAEMHVVGAAPQLVTSVTVVAPAQSAVSEAEVELVEVGVEIGAKADRRFDCSHD